MFFYISGRHRACQHRGCLYALICPYSPHTSVCPYPLYICMFSFTICSPYAMGTRRHLYTPYVLGSFGGHHYIYQAFMCLSVHPFAPQFITDILVAPHHCGLLLHWTGFLWMCAMLHAVVPFFVVFIMSQASTTMAMTTTPPLTYVFWYIVSCLNGYHDPLLDGSSSNIRSA